MVCVCFCSPVGVEKEREGVSLYSPVGVATAFAVVPLPLHERYVLPSSFSRCGFIWLLLLLLLCSLLRDFFIHIFPFFPPSSPPS